MYLLWKHFHLCFFKLKYPTSTISPSHPNQQEQADQIPSLTSSNKSIIMNKNNNLFNIQQEPHSFFHDFTTNAITTTTASSSDYSTSKSTDDFLFSSMTSLEEYSDSWDAHLPDLASVFASRRFFFSSPGRSNSIIESPDTRPSITGTFLAARAAGGVRVPKYSSNPYVDFRSSMQEMVEARELMVDERFDWDYLHELLLCYLSLNPTQTHKYIVRAFTDLVISLLSSSPSSSSSTPSPALNCCQVPKNIQHQLGISRRLVFN